MTWVEMSGLCTSTDRTGGAAGKAGLVLMGCGGGGGGGCAGGCWREGGGLCAAAAASAVVSSSAKRISTAPLARCAHTARASAARVPPADEPSAGPATTSARVVRAVSRPDNATAPCSSCAPACAVDACAAPSRAPLALMLPRTAVTLAAIAASIAAAAPKPSSACAASELSAGAPVSPRLSLKKGVGYSFLRTCADACVVEGSRDAYFCELQRGGHH